MENNTIFTPDDRLISKEGSVYRIQNYFPELKEFEEDVAYLKGDYFYLYRGKLADANTDDQPGIYYDSKKDKYLLFEVNELNAEDYTYKDKIGSLNPYKIINQINDKTVTIINFPEADAMNIPPISESDDILKRIIKTAMLYKRINIDLYKERFDDKNKLFNLKQVLKSDKPLSKLLFDRAVEALNLKYTIIVEEDDPESIIIGVPLEEPIIANSNDGLEL